MRSLEKVKEYLDRAGNLKVNAEEALAAGKVGKASEFLWGLVACYLNALNLIKTGRPAKSHSEMMRIGLDLAKNLGDEKFYRAIRHAEKLHANFYHLFLDIEDLRELYEEVMYAVLVIHRELEKEARL